MKLLGIDLATKTGLALMEGERLLLSGVLTCDAEAKSDGEFYGQFQERLESLLWENRPIKHAAIEAKMTAGAVRKTKRIGDAGEIIITESSASNYAAMDRASGLYAVATTALWKKGIPTKIVPVQSWRKSFLGIGRAPEHIKATERRKWWKQQAIQRCEQLRYSVKGDDAAEAVGICWWLAGEVKCNDLLARAMDAA